MPRNEAQKPAYSAAESLLRGYLLQDIRMDRLTSSSYEEVPAIEQEAMDEMAQAFEYEFPETERAAEAGRYFMKASFMQDELENWESLRERPEALDYTWVSDSSHTGDFMADDRWSEVREELETVCDITGIDQEYVDHKIKFLKYHEVGDPRYKHHAVKAEALKIQSMIDDRYSEKAEDLSRYFLKGVQKHDDWDEELENEAVELVAEYYREIADLR